MSQITISASSIDVRALGDSPEPSTSQKLTHMFILKIDGNKVLQSAKVPRQSLEWKELEKLHFTASSNIEIAIHRKSRVLGWRKPVLVGEYSGRGVDFLDASAPQELVAKSGNSRLAVKFHLVAESHANVVKAVDGEMPQLAKVKGANAAQTVTTTAKSVVLQASEQSHHTLSSDEAVLPSKTSGLESSDGKQNGSRAELSFITSCTSGNATIQNAGGNIVNNTFNGDYTVHQKASTDEINRQIALDTNARMKLAQHGLDKSKVQAWIYLADSDTSSNYNAARKAHLAGTGSWFLDGSQFTQWKEHPGSVLWLEGGPGSGKTVLSSSAVEDIIDFCKLKPLVRGYAYFYFDARNEKLRHLAHEKFTRSLISQLSHRCSEEIPTALVSLYNACDKGQTQPDLTSLEDTLLRVLECFEDTYIVIDSLDECAAKGEFLKWIHSVTAKTSRKPHLLVTSRTEWEIEKGLARLSSLRKVKIGDRSPESDIKAYIDVELAKTDKWKKPEDKEMIEEALSRHSKTFRFVALQLHDVMKCQNRAQLKKQLSSLPKDLNKIYERIFEQSDDPEELQKFLQWLAFSNRDMTRAEIDEVGTVNLGATDGPLYDLDRRSEEPGAILTVGYGLVTETNGTVKLAHFSVKEYLIERLKSIAERQGCTSEQLSHSIITQTCLAHLLYFDRESILDEGPPGVISKVHLSFFPLAEYAAKNWVYHFHSAHADYPHLLELSLKLFALPRSRAMINWVRLHDPDSRSRWGSQWKSLDNIASPLYYASLSGLTQVARHLIRNGADNNAVGGGIFTPLAAASANGHGELAKLLVDAGADVNAVDRKYGTALVRASGKGQVELSKLLLEAGADVNLAGTVFGTALYAASEIGHIELAKLLLDAGADVNPAAKNGNTPLYAASSVLRSKLAQPLLENGALFAPRHQGPIELVKLLLDNGADVNGVGGEHGTALQLASTFGLVELAQMLLDNGANVNAVKGRWGTALYAASVNHKVELIKILLDAGADINSMEGTNFGKGGTALSGALVDGWTEVVQLLLDNGADINAMGGEHGTVLQTASVHGDVKTVMLLLGAGADVNFTSTENGTALYTASKYDRVKLVMLLLDAGADVKVMGGRCGTPLQSASENGNVEIARLLLAAGADINVAGGIFGTALQACSWGGHVEVAKLLLAAGASVNVVGGHFSTALIAASWGGHVRLAKLLLDNGAVVNPATTRGNTALHIASQEGHQDVAKLLRERGAVEP